MFIKCGRRFKWKIENGSPGDFVNLFIVCSSCQRKFVICPFLDEETNGSYRFAKGLAHLWGGGNFHAKPAF